jgi:hypothetical protein
MLNVDVGKLTFYSPKTCTLNLNINDWSAVNSWLCAACRYSELSVNNLPIFEILGSHGVGRVA